MIAVIKHAPVDERDDDSVSEAVEAQFVSYDSGFDTVAPPPGPVAGGQGRTAGEVTTGALWAAFLLGAVIAAVTMAAVMG